MITCQKVVADDMKTRGIRVVRDPIRGRPRESLSSYESLSSKPSTVLRGRQITDVRTSDGQSSSNAA
jgi:hypothetical protein